MGELNNQIVQFYDNVVTNSLSIKDGDLSLVKRFFSVGSEDDFEPEEIAVFDGWLSNNIIDRSMNRVPKATLKTLNDTINYANSFWLICVITT